MANRTRNTRPLALVKSRRRSAPLTIHIPDPEQLIARLFPDLVGIVSLQQALNDAAVAFDDMVRDPDWLDEVLEDVLRGCILDAATRQGLNGREQQRRRPGRPRKPRVADLDGLRRDTRKYANLLTWARQHFRDEAELRQFVAESLPDDLAAEDRERFLADVASEDKTPMRLAARVFKIDRHVSERDLLRDRRGERQGGVRLSVLARASGLSKPTLLADIQKHKALKATKPPGRNYYVVQRVEAVRYLVTLLSITSTEAETRLR